MGRYILNHVPLPFMGVFWGINIFDDNKPWWDFYYLDNDCQFYMDDHGVTLTDLKGRSVSF